MKKLGIYIHIPFCQSKCLYCGFYSKAGVLDDAGEIQFLEEMKEDIKAYGAEYGKGGMNYLVDTIFIGGGTPSILQVSTISEILETVHDEFNVDKNVEVTIESNPATLSYNKLVSYQGLGINRLSIGCQSFDNKILKALGRIHTAEDFYKNYDEARKAGFDNVNIDLMFAVPGHNMEIWQDTLKTATELEPEHISFYSLQIEEGTPFYMMLKNDTIEEIPDVIDREMYHSAVKFFKEKGYSHYEISNCAKLGFECRHNLKYWSMDEYLGIGPTASSYIDGCRFTDGPVPEFHENDFHDNMSEFVFTGLRKTAGINLNEFRERYGEEFWKVFADVRPRISQYIESEKLIEDGDVLRLSLDGIDVSNTIMAEFV